MFLMKRFTVCGINRERINSQKYDFYRMYVTNQGYTLRFCYIFHRNSCDNNRT